MGRVVTRLIPRKYDFVLAKLTQQEELKLERTRYGWTQNELLSFFLDGRGKSQLKTSEIRFCTSTEEAWELFHKIR